MKKQIEILGFAGSLRENSYNKALLREAGELLPKDAKLEVFEIGGIPLFNQDLELRPPEIVNRFKDMIKRADAILIATPEYNHSIPGVLKNAIDWGSRPFGENSFDDKPVALMGASTGMFGTSRAQSHLLQVCVALNMHPLKVPGIYVTFAKDKFGKDGRLKDKETKELMKNMLENLIIWTNRLMQKSQ
jgi:chromate reductase